MTQLQLPESFLEMMRQLLGEEFDAFLEGFDGCLLYTSPSPRNTERSRMPSSA